MLAVEEVTLAELTERVGGNGLDGTGDGHENFRLDPDPSTVVPDIAARLRMRCSWQADRKDTTVRVVGIIADLHVADIESAKGFYSSYLGLSNEEFNLGWVARFTSPDTGANVQLVTHDASASEDPVISVKVDDVDAAYEDAQRRGYAIVHPLRTEAWGVRRFFVRAPDGNVINVVQHRD